MKATKIFLSLAAAICCMQVQAATPGIVVAKNDGEKLHIANASLRNLTFSGADALLTSADGQVLTIGRDAIESITPTSAIAEEYSVSFDGNKVSVVNPYAFSGVVTEIDGAYVTVTNANADTEMKFALSGSTDDGGYIYNGVYKSTLKLSNLSINSRRGAALDIKCGKRIAVEASGTNSFSDCAEGTQKACVYFKGHPEFTGSGTINIDGKTGHAISSKEYIQLKKSFGMLNVIGAEKDGVHAGQYFQMNGGTVTVKNVKGDGIQVEATTDETDELNGQMIIKGGKIEVDVTGDDSDCLKADSLMTISGGTIILTASGATSKAIKAKSDLTISGGEITATVTGNGIVVDTTSSSQIIARGPVGGGWPGGPGGGWDKEDLETSAPGCMKADGNLSITGGVLTLKATGKGGKCINVDGTATIGESGTEGPVISATTTGAVVSGSGENINGLPKAVKVYGDLTINSGNITCKTSQNGGEGIECKSALTINGGIVLCQTYDDGINAGSKITINGGVVCARATNNDGMDCNGSAGFEFNGGIILASGASRPEEGFDCDNYRFAINGGTVIGTGGATSSVTTAKQPFATSSNQSITANRYISLCKSDGSVICSYKVPNSISATILVSLPEFVSGSSYKIMRNVTSVNNPTDTYFDGLFVVGGTINDGTSVSITPRTK